MSCRGKWDFLMSIFCPSHMSRNNAIIDYTVRIALSRGNTVVRFNLLLMSSIMRVRKKCWGVLSKDRQASRDRNLRVRTDLSRPMLISDLIEKVDLIETVLKKLQQKWKSRRNRESFQKTFSGMGLTCPVPFRPWATAGRFKRDILYFYYLQSNLASLKRIKSADLAPYNQIISKF